MKKGLVAAALAAAALALVPTALADELLTLEPAGGGADTYTAWQALEGLPDSTGAASQALYFHHGGPAPAAVLVLGVEDRPVSFLTSLEWERRNDSLCTANDPRWTIGIRGASGKSYAVRLGCFTSIHSPGSAPGWTRDTNSQSVIRARIVRIGGKDALAGKLESLAIVVDKARGDAWLDNVQVVGHGAFRTWTSAADNGYLAPKPGGLSVFVADEAPLTEAETTPAEELLASLTPEEQYAISDEGMPAAG